MVVAYNKDVSDCLARKGRTPNNKRRFFRAQPDQI
jgi:hypothetical protein